MPGAALTALRAFIPAFALHKCAATHDADELATVTLLQTGFARGWEVPSALPQAGVSPEPVRPRAVALSETGHARVRLLPETVIDLDLPPQQRWRRFFSNPVNRYKLLVMAERWHADPVSSSYVERAHLKTEDQEYLDEYRGIVEAVNDPRVNLSGLIYNELSYERGAVGGCAGVLAAQANGEVIHARNVDMAEDVVHTQINLVDVIYMRQGKQVFVSTNVLGAVGVHTGVRPGAYSIAQNKRSGRNMTQVVEAMNRGVRPTAFSLRSTLQESTSFADAVRRLSSVELAAPAYFHGAGPGPYEGVVITRDPVGGSTRLLDPEVGRWYLVQTNDDFDKTPLDASSGAILGKLGHMTQADVNMTSIQNIMMAMPVLNMETTIFTQICQPSTGLRRINKGMEEATLVMERDGGVRIDYIKQAPYPVVEVSLG